MSRQAREGAPAGSDTVEAGGRASAGGGLRGRVAVVTGASSGIGVAVAERLCASGAAVVVGARREARLKALCTRLGEAGGEASWCRADVTRREDVQALVDTATDRHGRLDIVVNNAGIMLLRPLAEARLDEWVRMVEVNVMGVLHGLAAALPVMLEQGGGHVVNVGSLAGRRPFPGGAVYSATKFAVRSLSWGMQLELSSAHGIRVTDVQPGVVGTEILEHVADPTARERFDAAWEGRRALTPGDVADAVLHALTAPPHVNVNEILLRPTDQTT